LLFTATLLNTSSYNLIYRQRR